MALVRHSHSVLCSSVKVQSKVFSLKGNNDHTSSWTSSSSSISSASINSRGSLQSWMRVILTKRTENIYWKDNDISPPWHSSGNHLKLCWCLSSIISIPHNPFQLSCSFIFPTSGFFLVLIFHIQVWTGMALHCLSSFSALFPNLWSVYCFPSHPVCLNDSAANRVSPSVVELRALSTPSSTQWVPSEGLVTDGNKPSLAELDEN